MSLAHEMAVARERALRALDGAAVLIDGPANLQRGWEAIGGWLALSTEWLVFVPHGVNWQVGRVLVPVPAIRCARPCWTRLLGILPICPNSIAVGTGAGLVYRLVVRERQRWVGALRCLPG